MVKKGQAALDFEVSHLRTVVKQFLLNNDSHVVWPGDSLDLLKTMPNESVQLVITSPPYNIGKIYENPISLEEYLENQLPIIDEITRVLKPEGSICWQVGNYVNKGEIVPLDIPFYNIFKRRGLKLRNRMVWTFGHGLRCALS